MLKEMKSIVAEVLSKHYNVESDALKQHAGLNKAESALKKVKNDLSKKSRTASCGLSTFIMLV